MKTVHCLNILGKHTDLKDDILKLPASITSIDLDHVTMSGGVSLDTFTGLLCLTLAHIDIKHDELKLPASITSINLDHVTVSVRRSVIGELYNA